MVIWIIGLSGSGKTTLARRLINDFKRVGKFYINVDGDVIREIFDNDLGHTYIDRRNNAKRISRLCKFLEKNDLNVICSILSISEEDRNWNRINLTNYFEIYLNVEMEELIKRDSKGLYKAFKKGETKDVVGCDIEFEAPKNSNYVINNTKDLNHLFGYSEKIVKKILDG